MYIHDPFNKDALANAQFCSKTATYRKGIFREKWEPDLIAQLECADL
jgi:hypothetical protein